MEAVYCAIACVLFIIGMICMFAAPVHSTGSRGASIASGIVVIPAIVCFGFDAFKKYHAWRSGTVGPGQQMHSLEDPGAGSQGSTPVTPAY